MYWIKKRATSRLTCNCKRSIDAGEVYWQRKNRATDGEATVFCRLCAAREKVSDQRTSLVTWLVIGWAVLAVIVVPAVNPGHEASYFLLYSVGFAPFIVLGAIIVAKILIPSPPDEGD